MIVNRYSFAQILPVLFIVHSPGQTYIYLQNLNTSIVWNSRFVHLCTDILLNSLIRPYCVNFFPSVVISAVTPVFPTSMFSHIIYIPLSG